MSILRSRRPNRGGILPRSSTGRLVSEKKLEADHRKIAKRNGWFVEKIMKTGRGGFPDRLYIKDGREVHIEWKALGKKATPLQLERHAEMRAHGAEVYVVDNIDDANRILGIGNEL